MEDIRVLIAHSQRLIREGWAHVISRHGGFRVLSLCGVDPANIISEARTKKPDIVLLDLSFSPTRCADTPSLLKADAPFSRIVAAIEATHPAHTRQMLRCGADGFFTHDSRKEEMISAMAEVCKGKPFLSQDIRKLLAAPAVNADPSGLTMREREVAALICRGFSSRQIAAHLGVSENTVSTHRHRILQKLQLPNASALVNLFYRQPGYFSGIAPIFL